VAEILGELASESARLTTYSRWAEWEQQVLAKCSHVDECQRTIAERIAEIDDDDNEAFEIEVFFHARLRERTHNPDTEAVKIPTGTAAEWLSLYSKKNTSACQATTFLETKPLKRLQYKRETKGRYWIWHGEQATATATPVELGPSPKF
jgi:hypothetical protein